VAQLVENYAHEHPKDEPHPRKGRAQALALDVIVGEDGRNEQQEGPVQENSNPRYGPDTE
jgi:hypothetical protein